MESGGKTGKGADPWGNGARKRKWKRERGVIMLSLRPCRKRMLAKHAKTACSAGFPTIAPPPLVKVVYYQDVMRIPSVGVVLADNLLRVCCKAVQCRELCEMEAEKG